MNLNLWFEKGFVLGKRVIQEIHIGCIHSISYLHSFQIGCFDEHEGSLRYNLFHKCSINSFLDHSIVRKRVYTHSILLVFKHFDKF